MNNLTILDNYDMVMSYPLSTINSEIQKMVGDKTIQNTIILYRVPDSNGNYQYSMAANAGAVPKGAEYINANVLPQVAISASGNEVILVLNFISGTAYFADKSGFGPLAKIVQSDMTGWEYGFAVNLNQASWSNNTSGTSGKVRNTLNRLIANQFNIQYLFLDFVSSDLHSTDSATTKCPKEMVLFMSFYFSHLTPANNPYILGYSVDSRANSQYAANLPPSLKPTSAGYAVFHDGGAPQMSNLSFIMDTQGGHGQYSGSPAVPDSNWFASNDPAKAKLMIAHNCLVENLILQPFYQSLQKTVYGQISGQISVGMGNSYVGAKQPSGPNWNFTISNVGSGDDQYVNTFGVNLFNHIAYVTLTFNGRISVYKEVSKNDFFCTAHAHASSWVTWSGTVNISIQNGILHSDSSFQKTGGSTDSGKNSCADAFSWIGKILGGVLDVFTGWSDGGFFSNLASNAFSVNVPGVGTLQLALGNFLPALSSINILPSGTTYAASMVAVDNNGNLYITLS